MGPSGPALLSFTPFYPPLSKISQWISALHAPITTKLGLYLDTISRMRFPNFQSPSLMGPSGPALPPQMSIFPLYTWPIGPHAPIATKLGLYLDTIFRIRFPKFQSPSLMGPSGPALPSWTSIYCHFDKECHGSQEPTVGSLPNLDYMPTPYPGWDPQIFGPVGQWAYVGQVSGRPGKMAL